jgi:hypothetical protein
MHSGMTPVKNTIPIQKERAPDGQELFTTNYKPNEEKTIKMGNQTKLRHYYNANIINILLCLYT